MSFGFIFLAAFSGVFYSFKVFFYIFFDTKKSRNSVYYTYADELTCSNRYSNSTLGGTLAVLFLVLSAIVISFFFLTWLYVLKINVISDVSFFFGKAAAFSSYNFDVSALFNFKFLNTVICVFFFFLNFFKWNRVFFSSFESFFFIAASALFLVY